MVVTAVGFDGTVSEAQWAQMSRRQVEIAYRHGVWSGGDVSTAAGRAVTVAVIDAIAPGVWFTSDAAEVVAIAANGTSNARVDYVVAEVNWTTNAVTFKAVTGSSSTPPALTQNAGSLWQIPLALVTVAAGATSIPAANIAVAKPLPRRIYHHAGSVPSSEVQAGANGTTVGEAIVTDPGWPYRLRVTAAVRALPSTADRYLRLSVVDDTDSRVATGISGPLSSFQPAFADGAPGRVYTGATRLRMRILSNDSNGFVSTAASAMSSFDVEVIPA